MLSELRLMAEERKIVVAYSHKLPNAIKVLYVQSEDDSKIMIIDEKIKDTAYEAEAIAHGLGYEKYSNIRQMNCFNASKEDIDKLNKLVEDYGRSVITKLKERDNYGSCL